ncbi:trypsin-like peptidase domain-containing protein [bacterium]|nr:trypsin-like peptidase domain-containing protein [bacterium]
MRTALLFTFLFFSILQTFSQVTLSLTRQAVVYSEASTSSEILDTLYAGKSLTVNYKIDGFLAVALTDKEVYIQKYLFYVPNSVTIPDKPKKVATENTKVQNSFSEDSLKNHWKEYGIEDIEGIYELIIPNSRVEAGVAKYRLALVRKGKKFYLLYLDGAQAYYYRWSPGDIKSVLEPTGVRNLFKAKWYMADKETVREYYVKIEQGFLTFIDLDEGEFKFLKTYPSVYDDLNPSNKYTTQGTAFAISIDGILVTNYHVVGEKDKVLIKCIRNGIPVEYNASVIAKDKSNDLVLLKISDDDFTPFNRIPFSIQNNTQKSGSSVSILGYPLTSSMGEELKVTTGVLSSTSGYQGNVTTYQVSAQAQPGNSGGPCFNSNGDLIGVVSSKHTVADNATYVIKNTYLVALIHSWNESYPLPNSSTLTGLSLEKQVESLSDYVFIVIVS